MIKLLEPKFIYLFFAIITISFFNPLMAQTSCPAPTNLVVTNSVGQINLSWTPSDSATIYLVNVTFDNGVSTMGSAAFPTVSLPAPSGASSASISVSSVCANGLKSLELKGFIIITQGDIDRGDCSPDSEEMAEYCKAVERLGRNIPIYITFRNGCRDKKMSKDSFESAYCKERSRLPSTIPTRVLPNPFDADFRVQFSTNELTEVSINLYGSNGQLIRQLMNHESIEPGINYLRFEGRDLPSGVYFVRMAIDDVLSVYRLVKMK